MAEAKTSVRLSKKCLDEIKKIQQENNLKSYTAGIEFMAGLYSSTNEFNQQLKEMDRKINLTIKHINELRRNDYLLIDLLNAVTMELNISEVVMHHKAAFRSSALQSAMDNLSVYLNEVQTQIDSNRIKKKEE